MKWQDKLQSKLLETPYVHVTFTLPHQLNGLARKNQKAIYDLIMRASWQTIYKLSMDPDNIGGLPGMTSVLHTFGSDLKYHIHVHCLVTFGGLDSKGVWHWPKRKNKLASFRDMRKLYKIIFLRELKKLFDSGKIDYHLNYEDVISDVKSKEWVVHNTQPTADTKVISEYLGRYICRIGISKNRVHYDSVHKSVTLDYKDYTNQKEGKAAPTKSKKIDPLVFMDTLLQHVCPRYFTKSRHQGLHSALVYKRIGSKIPEAIKNAGATVKKVIEIIGEMIKQAVDTCPFCEKEGVFNVIEAVEVDKTFLQSTVLNKSPPIFQKEQDWLF